MESSFLLIFLFFIRKYFTASRDAFFFNSEVLDRCNVDSV